MVSWAPDSETRALDRVAEAKEGELLAEVLTWIWSTFGIQWELLPKFSCVRAEIYIRDWSGSKVEFECGPIRDLHSGLIWVWSGVWMRPSRDLHSVLIWVWSGAAETRSTFGIDLGLKWEFGYNLSWGLHSGSIWAKVESWMKLELYIRPQLGELPELKGPGSHLRSIGGAACGSKELRFHWSEGELCGRR